MLSMFLPFILRILGMVLDNVLKSTEAKQAWIDFIEAMGKEGLASVTLGKMAKEQRARLDAGKYQKPGEDFSNPSKP